jgi:hypothetical protein
MSLSNKYGLLHDPQPNNKHNVLPIIYNKCSTLYWTNLYQLNLNSENTDRLFLRILVIYCPQITS